MIYFWRVFRVIFVVFSFYLVADAIYRWHGFRSHSSFSEFLPGVALITILWSIIALLTAIVIWLLLRLIKWASLYVDSTKYLATYMVFFLVVGATIWSGKKLIWPYVQTSFQMKMLILISVSVLAAFLSFLFHGKTERWVDFIQNRITPWVWLFGICVLVSVPVVSCHTGIKDSDQILTKEYIQASASDKSRPNIILFTFDALSTRNMSLYGYKRETTPFVRKWAEEGSVFTNVKAASCQTVPNTTSLMTGKRPWTHNAFQAGTRPVRSDIESLPALLKESGYYNMAFVSYYLASVQEKGMINSFMVAPPHSEFISPNGFSATIRKYLGRWFGAKITLYDWILRDDFILRFFVPHIYFENQYEAELPVEKVLDRFIAEIDNNLREPYFAWIHVAAPHFPFLAPEEFTGMFDPSLKFRSLQSQRDLHEPAFFSVEQQPDAEILRARYDEFVRYCDSEFQRFIDLLEKKDQLKRTVLILSSDHGTSFDHNRFRPRANFYEQVTNVPLVIKEPGQTKGRRVDDIVEQIDIPATILDMADISVPAWMEGRSLEPVLNDEKIPSKPALSMFLDSRPGYLLDKDIITVWNNNYKMIYFLDDEKFLLFNLAQDPNELNNLYFEKPDIAGRLMALIKANQLRIDENSSRGE